jgi:hypothetical protein
MLTLRYDWHSRASLQGWRMPPVTSGRRGRIYYGTQASDRSPSNVLRRGVLQASCLLLSIQTYTSAIVGAAYWGVLVMMFAYA